MLQLLKYMVTDIRVNDIQAHQVSVTLNLGVVVRCSGVG